MKLLIVTQVLDKNDPILGFFHRWVEEFAKHCEAVTVICLFEGKHDLPSNVRILSLGKEKGASRLMYLKHFYSFIWKERSNYDVVFTHMNPEYLILGAPLWRLLRKKIGMWYAHGKVTWRLRLATLLTQHIFTSTKDGFRLKSKKTHIVGQGIDCDRFSLAPVGDVSRMITVGRISKVKHLDLLVDVVSSLRTQKIETTLDIFGTALTGEDVKYEKELKEKIQKMGLETFVRFRGGVAQDLLLAKLKEYGVFINTGQTGSLDKAILEAMATGRIVVSTNPGAKDMLDSVSEASLAPSHTQESLVKTLEHIHTLQPSTLDDIRNALYVKVVVEHNLSDLVSAILKNTYERP